MRGVLVLGLLALAQPVQAQPANDDCSAATVIGALPFTDAVDTTTATTATGDPTFPCDYEDVPSQFGRSVWYQYTSPAGGSLVVETTGSDHDTLLGAWPGSCGSLGTLRSCNQSDFGDGADSEDARMIVTLAAGETVLIEVVSEDPGGPGGNLVVSVAETTVFQVHEPAADGSYSETNEVPDAAAGADGTFLVVWEKDDGYVVGRRFCATGAPLGTPFQISDPGDYAQLPRIARAGGDFVVVWYDGVIRGRRVTGSGVPMGVTFDVSDEYPFYYDFDVAGDAAGEFIVTWSQSGFYSGDGDEAGVFARRFSESGAPNGPAFQVNTFTTGSQRTPSVAAGAAGEFVVVWASDAETVTSQDGDDFGVFGQRFDADGLAVGGEFQVNVTTTDDQIYPSVAADQNGAFVVAWEDVSQDCGIACVMGRRFDAAGSPLGGEFVVSPPGTGPPSFYVYIDAARNAGGESIVAWADEFSYPRARRFAADGTPDGGALQVGDIEDDYQRRTRVALADGGDFVVVWEWAPFGSSYRLLGRTSGTATTCPASTGCPATPHSGCKQPTVPGKGNLTLKNQSPDTRDAIIWKWVRGDATSMAEIGNALATDTYTLCLYDGDDALVTEAMVPPGGTCGTKPCWKDLGGLGFRYADKPGEHGDVRKLVLKSGGAGQAKVIVKAQGAGVAVPPLPPTLPVRAQLASTTGACWDAEFRAAGVTQSTPTVFGARPNVGSPSGAFVD